MMFFHQDQRNAKEMTVISILDKSFVYHGAASHGDPTAFRERMKEYAKRPATSKWDKPTSPIMVDIASIKWVCVGSGGDGGNGGPP